MNFQRRTAWIIAISALTLTNLFAHEVIDSPPPVTKSSSEPYERALQPFLNRYCNACHGPTKQSAELTFHNKKPDSLQNDRLTWDKVVERLEKSEMPPKGKPQPAADEKQAAIVWIKSETAKANCEKSTPPGRVTLRRLNRAEYNNTIRDLLGLDFKPAEDFPSDDVGYGFDNIGDVLVMSPLLLEKYLTAAESILQKAFTGTLPPLPPNRVIRAREFKESTKATPGPERTIIFSTGDVSFTHNFPRDGDYVVLYRALGKQIDRDPVKMSLRIDDAESHKADLKPFAEGRSPSDREVIMKVKGGTHTIAFAIANPKSSDEDGKQHERSIVLGAVEIRGPLVPLVKAMPEAYRRIIIAQPGPDLSKADCAKRIVENFARRAFRRPPTVNEIQRLVRLVDLAESQGDSFERGIQLAVQAVLVSPHFIFKVENEHRDASASYPITDHELATRLSYFLWSSCPDDELSRLAERGELREDLEPQVRRMLADPKARALGEDFAGQWLQIRNLKSAAPDAGLFPQFDEALRDAMFQETSQFFDAMVREDRALTDFLVADFTFLNERLAKHYGIPGIKGEQFRRVSLNGTPRAGILTQASVLTVTSNVTRTSPIKRGKFIMENLLNVDVPPPPPEVPELSDAKDAVASGSLRQRMEIHRTNPDCAICHQKMDPLGFAFEHFDAIGAWRSKDGAFEIDPSGTLPDGRSFRDPEELRRLLSEKPDAFRRCLAAKLLTYALGRGVEKADRCFVDKICEQTRDRHDKVSALILAIVTSEPFQMRSPSRPGTNR
jgi:hypothetical protein